MPTHAPHNILVIANRACPCPALADELARRTNARPAHVHLVAPALNSRLRHWTSDLDQALDQAHDAVPARSPTCVRSASTPARWSVTPTR